MLKRYWETESTVCHVLDWIDDGAAKLSDVNGLANEYVRSIILDITHMDGEKTPGTFGVYLNGTGILTLDSDPKAKTPENSELMSDEEGYSDGNYFSKIMKFMAVHEFFHFVQASTQMNYKRHMWVTEGTARMFEDIVYDGENPYLYSAYSPMYSKPYIADILQGGIYRGGIYKTFAFWKLMQDKCTLDMSQILTDPLGNFHTIANSCSGLPNVSGNNLAGLFVQYNWAMLHKHDFAKIDGNEPNVFAQFLHNSLQEFTNTYWYVVNVADKVIESELDMRWWYNYYSHSE